METPIEVLRVEQSAISKELGRFRACDTETRSLYCREWAQYIYKKHFVWSAKTQEEIVPEGGVSTSQTTLTAGKYQINYIPITLHDNCDCDDNHEQDNLVKKERSSLLGKKFEELAASWSSESNNEEKSLLTQILEGCQLWMTLPSGYAGLPDTFEPVEFNPYPDAIPLVDDPKDPSQLLDPLIIERQALCLPSDCFYLLKNLTGDILLSHTTPTCHHTKPSAKTPVDLEVDRTIFNENEQTAVSQALKELSLALEVTWHPLNRFLQQLETLEKRRSELMGKGCQERIDKFVSDQKYISFVDNWNIESTKFKNKKSTEEEIKNVENIFEQHLDILKTCVNQFMSDFVPKLLQDIHTLTNDLWKIVVPTIYELGERMAARESSKGSENALKIDESLKSLDVNYLKKMESTKEVDSAKKRITDTLNKKVQDYLTEIDDFFKNFKETSRPNLSGRLEKLNNKDFKKKIKKLESGYYSIRQTFRYEVTEKIFPESLFCKFALVCLEPLLQEGEMAEAITIETEVKRFLEAYKDLWKQRAVLLRQFEQGVQTGRRELAGVLGKLFLKEGMRIQGDNLALKRQKSLLKSMGLEASEDDSKKKSKAKKKSSSGSSTPAQQLEPVPTLSTPVKKSPYKKTAPVTPPAEPVKKVADAVATKKSTQSEPVKTASVKSLPVSPEPVKKASPVKTVSQKPVVEDKKVVAEEKKPVVEEKKSVVEEKKPVVEEKKPVVEEKKPVVEEKKPVVEEKKPVVEEKKPVAEVKKPVAEVKKPIVEEKKPFASEYRKPDNKKPLASDLPPLKVKSSKIPAPAPIIEPRVEPKPVEKKKKVVAPKKKEVEKKVAEKKVEPVQQEEPIVVKTPVEENQALEVQDWNTICTSVSQQEPVVQDWNDLKAQVQLEETEKKAQKESPVSTTTSWSQPLETGWSSIAAKKPETTWSNAATVASDTSSLKDVELGGWGTPKKPVQSPALSVASSAWSTTATAGRDSWAPSPAVPEKPSTTATASGWNSEKSVAPPPGLNTTMTEKASSSADWNTTPVEKSIASPPGWNATPVEKSIASPPGWNATPVERNVAAPPGWNNEKSSNASSSWNTEKPVVTPPPGWNTAPAEKSANATSGWNTEKSTNASSGWNSEKSTNASSDWNTEKSTTGSSGGWNTEKPVVSLGGWNAEKPATSSSGWNTEKPAASSSSGWGPLSDTEKSATAIPATWGSEVEKPVANAPPGLKPIDTGAKSSWGPLNDTVEQSNGGWNVSNEKSSASTPSRWTSETVAKNKNDTMTSLGGWGQSNTSTSWTEENNKKKNSSWNTSSQKKSTSGWDNSEASWEKKEEEVKPVEVSTPIATISSKPPGLTVPDTISPSIPTSFGVTNVPQIQNPLPGNLAEMKSDMLALMCSNLHRENGSLLQAVYSMQQEMAMMTTRYTEIMGLAREREAQNLKLFESRKQTEMEEIRRYVLSLEARIKQMEEKNDRVTAGFGNQDLFAGYREEMKTTSPPNHQHQYQGSRNNNYRKLWKNNNVIRCGNCGETGHESTECKTNCRYCGSSEHLSEACPMN